jgi:RNase P/RNase MRP subunit POP5
VLAREHRGEFEREGFIEMIKSSEEIGIVYRCDSCSQTFDLSNHAKMTAIIDVAAKELAKAFADLGLAQHAGGEQALIELFGGALRGAASQVIRETKEKVK